MLRFLTAGESHGRCMIAILEGMVSGLKIDLKEMNIELRRRQLGYGRGDRMKIEGDNVEILSAASRTARRWEALSAFTSRTTISGSMTSLP